MESLDISESISEKHSSILRKLCVVFVLLVLSLVYVIHSYGVCFNVGCGTTIESQNVIKFKKMILSFATMVSQSRFLMPADFG